MRGNETDTPPGTYTARVKFTIPMRGNESAGDSGRTSASRAFTIPMRGNEQTSPSVSHVSPLKVYDPHEG